MLKGFQHLFLCDLLLINVFSIYELWWLVLRIWRKNGKDTLFDKKGLKKGPWTAEEDEILCNYVKKNVGHGSWQSLPKMTGFDPLVWLLWWYLV